MKAVSRYQNKDKVRVTILAEEIPSPMPTTTDGIDNVIQGAELAIGSILVISDGSRWMYYGEEAGWHEVPTSGGGGGSTVAGVSSFNGRRNSVVPRAGDYRAAQVNTSNPAENVQQALDRLTDATTVETELDPSSYRPLTNKKITEEINRLDAKSVPAGGHTGDVLTKKNNNDYETEWVDDGYFMKKADYDRDNNGYVDKSDASFKLQGPTYTASLKNTSGNTFVVTDEDKGKKNGVVPLDENRKILPEFLPDSIMNGLTNGGIFNATTRVVRLSDAAKSILGVSYDTMTLEDSRTVPEGYPANAELYYITTNAGTFASMDFTEGDWLISLGNKWEQLKNGNQVSSVNGETGAVILDSDDIDEGTNHLYLTPEERAKLRDIEAEATKDLNVVQSAAITTLQDGTRVLRLTNKNGTVTDFEGSAADMTDYLKKDGNASSTYAIYNPTGIKQSFTGNELMHTFHGKVVSWLNLIDAVGWSGSFNDLRNKPERTSDFINDGEGLPNQPFVTRTVQNLANYYDKNNTYTKAEVDDLIAALQGNNYIVVEQLPISDIDLKAIYYVPVDPEDETKGYNRWQRMSGRWVFLGTSDISMNDYVKKTGDVSKTTATFTMAAERANLTTGEKIEDAFGKLSKWFDDFKQICFTASWQDLEDSSELATKEDLEDYVEKQWPIEDAGKVLAIDSDGKVYSRNESAGVGRPGAGDDSVIFNDTIEDIKNSADGQGASAFGEGTIAKGKDQQVRGRYNEIDNNNTYADIVGAGTSNNDRANIHTTDWTGKGWYKNGVSVGNTTTHVVEPTQGNDLTTKTYVDRTIDEEIQQSKLLKAMRVESAPAVEDADDNILYFVPDPTSEGHYMQYKKLLVSQNPDRYEMASMGGTQLTMQGMQVKNLPTPSRALDGTVYQFVGTNAAYTFGAMYACLPVQFYAWWDAEEAKAYYTDTLALKPSDPIYGTQVTDKYHEATKIGPSDDYLDLPNRIRDQFNYYGQPKWYTRYADGDVKGNWRWVKILSSTGDMVNNGNGTGAEDDYFVTKADLDTKQDELFDGPDIGYLDDNLGLTHFEVADKTAHQIRGLSIWNYIKSKFTKDTVSTVSDTTKLATVDNSKANVVQETTAKALFDYMWKKIYPVGSIYTTITNDDPGTLFGGTWVLVGANRVLWGVDASTGAGGTLNEQLPDIRGHIDWATGGQAKTEISSGSGAFNLTNKNLGAAYPTGSGASNSARGFDFRASYYTDVYKLNASVRPAAYTVHFWKRTA